MLHVLSWQQQVTEVVSSASLVSQGYGQPECIIIEQKLLSLCDM